ncbi:MAG: PAS domain S-box protein, partial [Euryarchaeota archaeon]|nr:PAS domain S-box protein [Euryarchaeota archaeon]
MKKDQSIKNLREKLKKLSESKEAEDDFKEDKGDYQVIFDNLPVMAFTLDRRGRLLEANREAERITGLRSEDFKGKSFSKFGLLSKKDTINAFIEFIKNIRGNVTGRTTYKVNLMNGREILLELIGIPLEEKDKVRKVLIMGRDVTEEKKAEKDPKRSKNKIEQLHKVAVEMESAKSEEKVYQFTVDAAEKILEFDICELEIAEGNALVIKATSSGMPPEGGSDMRLNKGIAGKTYKTKKSYLTKGIRKEKDAKPSTKKYRSGISIPIGEFGVFQAASTRVAAFVEEDLELGELLVSHTAEALKRIQSEKELQQSEEKYRSLTNRLPVGIYRTDKDGTFLHANPALATILEFDDVDDLMKTQAIGAYKRPEERSKQIKQWKSSGKTLCSELEFRTKKGRAIWVRDTGRVVLDENGTIKYINGIIEDITDQKISQEKLSAIYDLSKEMSLSLDMDRTSKIVLDATEKVLKFDNVDLFLVDEEKKELYLKETRGLKEPEMDMILPIYGEKGIAPYAVRTGEPLNVPDVRKDKRYIFGLKDSRSELSVPIKVKNKVIGVLDAESKELNAFSEEDQMLLETLASQAGIAIQN